jgi:flagellar hook protein FlgE
LSGITQYAGANTLAINSQNGSGMGSLQGYSISPDGIIEGVFSNGLKAPLAQIAMATFNNPPGMEKVGNSSYRATTNSGNAQVGVSGTGGRGLIAGGALEMSNVDLAAEFTQLIVSERGFQANSRVITSADEILQDLVNLKR